MQIAVKYSNPPKEGKKFGNIKSQDGTAYFWNPRILGPMPQQGGTIEATVANEKWGDSVVNVITSVTGKDADSRQPSPGLPNPPRVHQGSVNANERMIFITGVVGRAMGSGQFSANDVKLLALAARDAYEAVTKNIIPDEIPY
jgi:hypothetical protein